MAVISRSMVVATIIVSSFATTVVVTHEALAAENRSQPHIAFSSSNYSLEKTGTDVKKDREGWAETAKWHSAQGDPVVFINVFARVLYNKVFMRSYVQSPRKRVKEIMGNNAVIVGADRRVDTESGFYEYQMYSLNGIECAYIQSYWADTSFGGVDIVRGAKSSDKIVGNHMLQVVACDQRKKMFLGSHVTEILSSIDLRDAYWSPSWFVTDTNSAVPGVTANETTLDKQAAVESKPDTKLEGVSGTYHSEITSSVSYWFQHKKHRKMIVTLKQEGKRITGTDNIGRSELTGTIEGDTIRFNYWSGRTLKGSEVNGEWKVIGDGSRLEGFWTWQGSPQGKWNLTRIE